MARTTFSGPVKSDNGFEGDILGFVTPPAYTLATLPANADYADGTMIYVSDATNVGSGTGTICFNDGTDWIDISTGIAVA
jgi:hypothetical protein